MDSWLKSHLWVVGCAAYALFMIPIFLEYQYGVSKWFSYVDLLSLAGAMLVVFGQALFALPKRSEEA